MSPETMTTLLIVCLPLAPVCLWGVLWCGMGEVHEWAVLPLFAVGMLSGLYDIVVVLLAVFGWVDLASVKVEQ